MKSVGSCRYVHRSNTGELKTRYPEYADSISAVERSARNRDWAVMKLDLSNGVISLIESPDWDTAYEPVVGDSMIYDLGEWTSGPPTKISKARTKNPQIYHMKELFVAPDYKGFDIGEARRRTDAIARIPGIDFRKKGNAEYWDEAMRRNGMPVDRRTVSKNARPGRRRKDV